MFFVSLCLPFSPFIQSTICLIQDQPQQFRTFTLSAFCAKARELLEGDDIPAFVRFVLNGIEEDTHVVLDPILNRLRDDDQIAARRDYDSMLGIDRDIVVESDVTAIIMARPYQALSRNIYIKHSIPQDPVRLFCLSASLHTFSDLVILSNLSPYLFTRFPTS